MKEGYRLLGDFIQPIDERNKELKVDYLLGVSISKQFIPSIANIVGTDLSNYKIVRTGQFAYGPVTSRNGEKISIALLRDSDCIISSSYTVFEVTDKDQLDPEYLMLWFSRPEFDRYARYKEYGCESVAFPLISSGIFGYPKDQALKVAIDTISSFLLENEMTVYIVIFDRKAYQISGKLFADIASYIDDRYVDEHTDSRSERLRRMSAFRMEEPMPCESPVYDEAIEKLTAPMAVSSEKAATLDDALGQIDESFLEMLLRKIDERGMTDAQCYKKANIDRKLFSKIRSDKSYKPSKPTTIALV